MTRTLSGWTFCLLLLLPLAGKAQDTPSTPSAQAIAQTQLRLEQSLLSLDLVGYNEARERVRRAQQGVNDVLARLDEALAGDSVSLGTLETLQDSLDAARAASRITEDRLSALLEKIQERLRRIGLLQGGQTAAAPRAADPVTGRWRVAIFPQNLTATYDLRLSGSVVSGSYTIDGSGSVGSFRGTYSGGVIRFERVDANTGFDSVWEGTVGTDRIIGTWMTNELVTGQPTRGDWTAVRESGQQP